MKNFFWFVTMLLLFCQAVHFSATEVESTLITNVQIVDGTGAVPFIGAVRIQGNRILEVGDLQPKAGERTVDGGGKVLAPGFIDTHSHHNRGMFEKRGMEEVVSQGVTTIVIGQDGGAYYPLRDFWKQLDSIPIAVNVASYAGHNTIRRKIMSVATQAASKEEIVKMQKALRQELKAGALGLSTGLEYDPGIYSNRAEILQLASVLAEQKRRYISHIRSEDVQLWQAIEEIINIGKTYKIPVQISHTKIAMVSQWGKADSLLQLLDTARAQGVDITADIYPYEFWQSTMTVLFPKRDFTDLAAAKFALSELTTPEGMVIADYAIDKSIVGKTLAEVAKARNQAPEVVYLDLVQKIVKADADESIICTSMNPADIAKIMTWKWTNICSDGALNPSHPRGAGSFTKILRKYVREEKHLTLAEAIHKMTGLAAQNMGFKNRGLIKPGYFADLVLFDPETVTDHATIEQPGALSTGILKVWTNGQEVWNGRKTTGKFSGKAIKAE